MREVVYRVILRGGIGMAQWGYRNCKHFSTKNAGFCKKVN